MRKASIFICVIVAILGALQWFTPAARAQMVLRVPADVPTIQGAIAAAAAGDSVLVSPGTYVENLNFLGKAITVESEGGPAATIIDGNQAGPVVTFASGEGTASVLRGFTLRNGYASFSDPSYGDGGGINIRSSSPVIENNVITDNLACTGAGIMINFGSPIIQGNSIKNNAQAGCSGGIGGGGISIGGNSNALILDNVIAGNLTGSSGGGISLFAAGTPTIMGNVIRENTTLSDGGGMSLVNNSDALIVQNVMTGNSARQGGGIYWLVPSGSAGPLLVNNTLADNDSPAGSGIYADGFDAQATVINNLVVAKPGQVAIFCGDFNDMNPPVIRFNDIYSASGAAYGGICADRTGIDGNISVDPIFVDPANGNYHLQWGSPAVDQGDNMAPELPARDVDGDARITDGDGDTVAVVDLGADELRPVAPAPAALAVPAADDDGSYRVTWSASPLDGVIYILQEATSPDFSTELRVTYAGRRRFADLAGRSQDVTYYYRVKARKPGFADSSWRRASHGCAVPGAETVKIPGVLAVPQADADGKYLVKWDASATAGVAYLLEEATSPDFTTGLRIAYLGVGLQKVVGARERNQTYYYRVQAIKAGWRDSSWRTGSNGCAVPGAIAAVVPGGLTVPAADADGRYTVTWGPSVTAGVTYVLEEAVTPLFNAGLRVVYCGPGVSAEVVGRIQGRTYYYRVKAIKPGVRDSAWRMAVRGCAVPGTTRAPAPESLAVPVAAAEGVYPVSWGASATPGAAYVLEEATNPVFTRDLQTVYSGPALSRILTGRAQNRTYYYRVKTIVPGVMDSTWLAAANGCAVPGSSAVASPAILTVPASDTNGSYQVSWSASSTPSASYRLEEATDAAFTQGARTAYFGMELAVIITGRVTGKTYYYRVRAQRPGYRDSDWRQAATAVAIIPPPGPDENDFFPNVSGDTWFFNVTESENGGPPVQDLSRLSVIGTRTVLGQTASVFQQITDSGRMPIEYYFAKDSSGVMNLGNNDPEDTLTPQLIPYRELVFPLQVGPIAQITRSGLDYGSDLDGDLQNESINLVLQSSLTGFDPLQVPAGTFPNAGKRLTVMDGDIILSASGFSIPVSASEETWAVAGVGAVKQVSTTSAAGTSVTASAEARGYIVGGVGHGMGWPATVANDLSPGNGYVPVPSGHPVVATDGTNYLVMAKKATGAPPEWRAHWIGILIDADGLVLKTFNATASTPVYDTVGSRTKAALAFDGKNYLFVYEQDDDSAYSGPLPPLAGVRISPDGKLLGSSVPVAPSGANLPAISFDGTNFLLVYRYREQVSGLYQICGVFISPATGQIAGNGAFAITSAPGYQENPAVAFDGTNYLVVWDQGLWEAQNQTPGIYAARVARDGTVLEPGDVVVYDTSALPVSAQPGRPAVAFDGTNYLVVYEFTPENLVTRLAGMRISVEGHLLDGTPVTGGFPVTTNDSGFTGDVSLTFTGNEYWAAWVSSPAIGVNDGIFGARIGVDGVVRSPGSSGMRMGPRSYSFSPALTANPSGGYLVWLNPYSANSPYEAVGLPIYSFGP